ncbi:MAG: peptidase caspase catalytic subunit p20 [Rhodoferax sp.]|nr:peptidase caspase catalytic subunit p20 [Rhodoferax sp.]
MTDGTRRQRPLKPLWLVALALGLLLLAPLARQAWAQAGGTIAGVDAPQLHIEPGAHTAPIRALSIDAGGRYAVTAAEDKTARVWDLATGAQLQVLRPPAGPGGEGRLYAAALSPDGRFIATGGWSAQNDVYVFQRGSGQLVHRITGLPNVITHLVFTPDGRQLVVNLWGRNGIRLYASDDGWRSSREAGADRDYAGESYGADISRDGSRLVTSAFDGLVRLYALGDAGSGGGAALRLLKGVRVPTGQQPFALAFSPDRQRIAVGFGDVPAVAVLDGAELSTAYLPSARGVDNGTLSAVAWSQDGRQLFAAGAWKRADGQHGVRRWADAGRGAATDTTVAGNSVVALRTLADGRLVFAATDPAWGVLTPSGELALQSRAGLADFRGDRARFRLSATGAALAFPVAYGNQPVAGFDLDAMAWTEPAASLQASPVSSQEMALANWLQSPRPQLNGRDIALEPNEVALSAALDARGNTSLALGTSFYLRLLQRDGRERWRMPAPGSTWQVAQSQDGRWVVAAFGDGSIRWYRSADGAEQLALLPHADRRRWVAWTPQGYYAASPGGEDLIGWQLDRGPARAADFFAGSRFRAGQFRPDVIAQTLATANAAAALQTANSAEGRKTAAVRIEQQLPPVVNLLSPVDGEAPASTASSVRLEMALRTQADAPVTSLRVRVNGRVVAVPAAEAVPRPAPGSDPAQEVRHTLTVPLPGGDAEIMVFAENRNGFSTPAVLRLRAPAVQAAQTVQAAAPVPPPRSATPEATPPGGIDTRPALYVLAVGIAKYRDAGLRLDYPAKDATDFAAAFQNQQQGLYRKVVVKLLKDETARRDDVLDGLEWIRREMTARDVGVVFLAGHGVNDSDGVYYYLPQDVDTERLKRSGVIFTEIKNTLAALPGKVLFFVDTCHAGNVLGTGRRGVRNDITAIVNELSSAENGVVVFAASTGRQEAQESSDWGNGAFTKAVIEGVRGQADFAHTGRVTHKMLDLYIAERVKALTRGSQSPVTIVPQGVPDFPLVLAQ